MATKISGVVLGVNTQSGVGKNTGRPYTKFTIQFSNGTNYDTFDAAISGLATKLQGQPVEAYVQTTMRNGFTNNDILAIAPEGQLPEQEFENTQTSFTPQNNVQNNGAARYGDRDQEIRRAVALKAAVDIEVARINDSGVNTISMIEENFDRFDRLLANGPQQGLGDTPTTPEEVASTVPNVTTGADRNW
jgi:hypothetical protein